jgi:hypothetical protein
MDKEQEAHLLQQQMHEQHMHEQQQYLQEQQGMDMSQAGYLSGGFSDDVQKALYQR